MSEAISSVQKKILDIFDDVASRSSVVAEMFRVLLEGGRIFIWDPAHRLPQGLPLVSPLRDMAQLMFCQAGDLLLSSEIENPSFFNSGQLQHEVILHIRLPL